MQLDQTAVDRFFWFARERQAVYLRRLAGRPAPWTADPILSRYSFTNLYREQDRTTRWFRESVRDPLRGFPDVLLATVVFRWFNTVRSGEVLFCQPDLLTGLTPWGQFLATGEAGALSGPLRISGPPWVTGAYMIRSPTGVDKLDGVTRMCETFNAYHSLFPVVPGARASENLTWREVAALLLEYDYSLQELWRWLLPIPGMGPFLAYEVVTDLRHTALLDRAPDVNTWANPGPGALRGAALMLGREGLDRKGRLKKASYEEAHAVMAELLDMSRSSLYWPQVNAEYLAGQSGTYFDPSYKDQLSDVLTDDPAHWPAWEMREPEMQLCEHVKWERTNMGIGRPRGNYPRD